MDSNLPHRSSSLGILITVIVLVGVVASAFIYIRASASFKEDLLNRARAAAAGVVAEDLALLSGTEADLGNPAYIQLKQYLSAVPYTSEDIRFAYVMGKSAGEEPYFYADSEDPSSPDYSPPGQSYFEASDELKAMFEDAGPRTEGPTRDRWGVWISAYMPIVDDEGKTVGVFGLDIPANNYFMQVFAYAALPLLLAGLLTLHFLVFRKRAQNPAA